ncbi:hypothetical protein [Streptomyces sp. AGS-58]
MKAFRKFIVGLSFGLATWGMTAFVPVIGPWSPVLGLAVALVL